MNFTSVVQGKNITLAWEYNVDGKFAQAQFSDLKKAGKEKAVAVKSSANGNVVVASDYQERFIVRISASQTLVTILRAQKADIGKYKLQVINRKLETINGVVEVSVHCKYYWCTDTGKTNKKMARHHRHTGIFLPGGGGEPFAQKKFLQVAQIFTKQSKGNEGHTMH